MKLGLLLCAFNCEDYLEDCLSPWTTFDNVVISVTSCPFKHFEAEDNTKTLEILDKYKKNGKIDSYFTSEIPLEEYEARNLALNRLLTLNCDVICLWDSDEIITQQEISNLLKYLDKEKETNNLFYRINYKNLTFTEKTYTDNFDPARIFWVNKNGLKLDSMYSDNDFYFKFYDNLIKYSDLCSTHVPREVCFPLHKSWINGQRSVKKVNYQKSRGWTTTFNIDESGNLVYNEDWFKLTGKQKPILYNINE